MQAWPVLEPSTPFVDGIHVHAICEHLQAITEGRIQNLIINVPPGHAKSLMAAVFWLALGRHRPTRDPMAVRELQRQPERARQCQVSAAR